MPTHRIFDERSRKSALGVIAALDLSKPWALTIEREKRKRSLSQNALYWKWLGIASEESGHDPDELHEYYKHRFVGAVMIDVDGESFAYRTTTGLSTAQMTAYLEKVSRDIGSRWGLALPSQTDDVGY